MVGAALNSEQTYSGLIADNIHVHPGSMEVAIKSKTNIMLVTDAMSLVGSEKTSFEFFGQTISRSGNTLRDSEGRLAGSMLDMNDAVKNISNLNDVTLADAIKMASENPARFLGIESHYGSISIGKKASMILLNNNNNISHTWVDGDLVYEQNSCTITTA